MEKFIKIKKIKRARKHGFLSRSKTRSGQDVLSRRRKTKRHSLTV